MKKEFKFSEELKLGDSGIKFKRKVLGICGKETIKSIDELVNILFDLKIVNTKKVGKQLINNLDKKYLIYNSKLEIYASYSTYKCLYFESVENKGINSYKIRKSTLIRDEEEDF